MHCLYQNVIKCLPLNSCGWGRVTKIQKDFEFRVRIISLGMSPTFRSMWKAFCAGRWHIGYIVQNVWADQSQLEHWKPIRLASAVQKKRLISQRSNRVQHNKLNFRLQAPRCSLETETQASMLVESVRTMRPIGVTTPEALFLQNAWRKKKRV